VTIILPDMLVVLLLLVRPHMPGRSKVKTQKKRGWGLGHEANKISSIKKNLIIEKPNGCWMDNIGHTGEKVYKMANEGSGERRNDDCN
jgi:hypothetical protein